MSLLHNEDFAIYQLRTSYLASIQDGIGERLINVDTAFLNDPAFRAAGWTANPSELKRTYSPPIPTSAQSDYFQAPVDPEGLPRPSLDDDEEGGGMVTGEGAIGGEALGNASRAKRRKRREQLEEEDSSDLSDESEDESEAGARPAQQIRFKKSSSRDRSSSSPLRDSNTKDGPAVLVTSPSRPPQDGRLRSGSLGAVEAIKARARRDTTTSSEFSSENDMDPSVFQRRQVALTPSARGGGGLAGQLKDDQPTPTQDRGRTSDDGESDSDSLTSGFSDTVNSTSILDSMSNPLQESPLSGMDIPQATPPRREASREKTSPVKFQELPPPRPVSMAPPPVSALAQAIKDKNKGPANFFDKYVSLKGESDPHPLYIKLYLPSSEKPDEPLELVIRRSSNSGLPVTVEDVIGYGLWKYTQEDMKPSITEGQTKLPSWTFRIVDDGEPDYDVPPIDHSRPLTDFTFNNNRGGRGRSREKPWDEFAAIAPPREQGKDRQSSTATVIQMNTRGSPERSATEPQNPPRRPPPLPMHTIPDPSPSLRYNPITQPRFVLAAGPKRKDSSQALDSPVATTHAAARSDAKRTLNIHYTDTDLTPHTLQHEVTIDTYIAEVLDQVCKRLNYDKGLYVLRISKTNPPVVAPQDRTIEALPANRQSLDLTRRRFGEATFGPHGSPGSTSPSAPLILTSTGTPKKYKRAAAAGGMQHPLAQASTFGLGMLAASGGANERRFAVVRKQPMSFAPSQQKVLALTDDYMHILPNESGRERLFESSSQGKTTNVPFSSVVGCKVNRKHPKTFRVVVFKEREQKRYDFEAGSSDEAAAIVAEIKKRVEPFQDMLI